MATATIEFTSGQLDKLRQGLESGRALATVQPAGFLKGRVAYERFVVDGEPVRMFDETHLATLEKYSISGTESLRGAASEIGFAAGGHVLDMDFALEKNIVNDALHFAMRVDTFAPPSDLLKAYMQIELDAIASGNPSGRPTKRQRAEAKEAAEHRLSIEAQSGKFHRRKLVHALWDSRGGVLYLGTNSATATERFLALFKEAFKGRSLTHVTSGTRGLWAAEELIAVRRLEDLAPSVFCGPTRPGSYAWTADQFGSRDFLGNEFLVWLWWVLENKSDSIALSDDSTATVMMNRSISLECPLSETGKDTMRSESPVRLPEAKRALAAGKIPRKAGLIVVRHDEQYELTLQAETLGVSSASLPKLEDSEGRGLLEDRVDQIRHMAETIDLLFEAFMRRRLGDQWAEDREEIWHWLEVE